MKLVVTLKRHLGNQAQVTFIEVSFVPQCFGKAEIIHFFFFSFCPQFYCSLFWSLFSHDCETENNKERDREWLYWQSTTYIHYCLVNDCSKITNIHLLVMTDGKESIVSEIFNTLLPQFWWNEFESKEKISII